MSDYRALLVDDEEELAATLAERLQYRGFDAKYATCSTDALKYLREETFDVVVVDLKLPGISGEALIHTMTTAYPHLPVLMMTGHGSQELSTGQNPAGVYALLIKPIDISELVTKMTEAIAANGAHD